VQTLFNGYKYCKGLRSDFREEENEGRRGENPKTSFHRVTNQGMAVRGLENVE